MNIWFAWLIDEEGNHQKSEWLIKADTIEDARKKAAEYVEICQEQSIIYSKYSGDNAKFDEVGLFIESSYCEGILV